MRQPKLPKTGRESHRSTSYLIIQLQAKALARSCTMAALSLTLASSGFSQITESQAASHAAKWTTQLGQPFPKGISSSVSAQREHSSQQLTGFRVQCEEVMVSLDLKGRLTHYADMSRSALLPTTGKLKYSTEAAFFDDIRARLKGFALHPGLTPEPVAYFRKSNPTSELIDFSLTQSAFGFNNLRYNCVIGKVHRRTGRFVNLHINRDFTIVKPKIRYKPTDVIGAVCGYLGGKPSDWKSQLEYSAVYDFDQLPELKELYGNKRVRLCYQVFSNGDAVYIDAETGHVVRVLSHRKHYILASVNKHVRGALLKLKRP